MKYIFSLLMLVSSMVFASPAPENAVEKMTSQSEFYMNCDICQVANDTTNYPPGTYYRITSKYGTKLIPIADYKQIQNAGKELGSSGFFVMTERVQDSCKADWDGNVCTAARFLWKQEWAKGECVKPDGTVYKAVKHDNQ